MPHWDLTVKTKRSRLKTCLLYDFLVSFCVPVLLYGCLSRTGNYRILEFDWLKSVLKTVKFSPIQTRINTGNVLRWKCSKLKCNNIDYSLLAIFISRSSEKPDNKKSKEDKQDLAELSSAHRRSQAKCQLTTNQLH